MIEWKSEQENDICTVFRMHEVDKLGKIEEYIYSRRHIFANFFPDMRQDKKSVLRRVVTREHG